MTIYMIFFKSYFCMMKNKNVVYFRDSVDYYTLHIAEDDGEVDWDFPCLDNKESVTKFTFNFLALVESDPKKEPPDRLATRYFL